MNKYAEISKGRGKRAACFVENADLCLQSGVKTVSLAAKLLKKAVAIYVNGCIIILNQGIVRLLF